MSRELSKGTEEFVKVQFYDPAVGYENLWALPLGDGKYRLENAPFFVYDVSATDVISARANDNGILGFEGIVRRSGNRTLRARSDTLLKDRAFRTKVAKGLEEMGCGVEEHRDRLLAISVPPTTRLELVGAYLSSLGLSWEYGDPARLNT